MDLKDATLRDGLDSYSAGLTVILSYAVPAMVAGMSAFALLYTDQLGTQELTLPFWTLGLLGVFGGTLNLAGAHRHDLGGATVGAGIVVVMGVLAVWEGITGLTILAVLTVVQIGMAYREGYYG